MNIEILKLLYAQGKIFIHECIILSSYKFHLILFMLNEKSDIKFAKNVEHMHV